MMYLLKAMVVIFKSFLRTSSHMESIVLILRAIIQLIFTNALKIIKFNLHRYFTLLRKLI